MAAKPEATRSNNRIVHRLLRARDWQDRPQFAELCDWWRSGLGGVCALVGIGGAGKTAIADRFLRSMPGVLETPGVEVDSTLRPPSGLFVFSFYDAPNPESFFANLTEWLAGGRPAASYHHLVLQLERQSELLLVLDGLERVQDTGHRGGYLGSLLDNRLRDLVLRAAEGYLPGNRFLITSRFRLMDALAVRSPRFRQVSVEKLPATAAVALLRQRGVKGPDPRLLELARDQGFHALSVDLLGGFISRFGGGDPTRWHQEDPTPTVADLDPQMAELREQERLFGRLAQRYGEALAVDDPGALALLQRICLFRLGVGTGTLAAIFLGEAKEAVSGAALAHLDSEGLRAKLDLLVSMKLVERDEAGRFQVHPAVRDGFLNSLGLETSRRGHEAVSEGLNVALGAQPERNSSDPAMLDLLEEIVHHTLAAGQFQKAFDIYWHRLGQYQNLGSRLGAYQRGERICRAFAGGHPPEKAPLPKGLSENDQAAFLGEWALYLQELGQLVATARCDERALELLAGKEDWASIANCNKNLAYVQLRAGRLPAAAVASEAALDSAERADDWREQSKAHGFRGSARALRGEISDALVDFRDALYWQSSGEGRDDRPLYSLRGIGHTLLLARLGFLEQATISTEGNKKILHEGWGLLNSDLARCNHVLADLERQRMNLDKGWQLLESAHEWAVARDAKELLCWAALVRARLEATRADARRSIEEGLRIARDCGYGIYHIDLLLLRARLALEEGDPSTAMSDLNIALISGIHPAPESTMPELLAATDPECDYAWGKGDGWHLRGEALLLAAAQRLGSAEFAPARFAKLPEEVRGLVAEAREELERSQVLREQMQDPQVAQTKEVLALLASGVLTRYSLERAAPVVEVTVVEIETREVTEVAKTKHVFLSYVRENTAEVERLRGDLIAAGIGVWWDRDIDPGANWKTAIRTARENAFAFILCLSAEMEKRDRTYAFPEVRDAIGMYRQLAPGKAFIFPVRFSECEIPNFEIDSTSALRDLQRIDLFPPSGRQAELDRLIQALKRLQSP